MKIHELIQGTSEWLAYRTQHFNASDAPAMLGCSPYKTRAQLLRELHTGIVPEVDTATHMRYANGHRVEALARPLAEEFIGQELYPVTGSLGKLSASFDGLTLDESIGFEHKALNEELLAVLPTDDNDCPCDGLPLMHRVQMEQQLLVSGAERILFVASEWTADGELVRERHCWYYPDLALRQQIIDGWAQFERDLAAYTLPEATDAAPVGKSPETLPALRIEVTGQVTASNLAEFKSTALAAIRGVNRDLRSDQDFADAEKAVKWCAEVESRLTMAKEHALSQTASIDALFKAIDDISAEARRVRLDLDKLVTRRKTEVKEQAISRARNDLAKHVAALNAEIAPMRLPDVTADFAGAIKGLKSFASMQDKLDQALVAAKIEADARARLIRANLLAFKAKAASFEFLFADLGQLVHKAEDDFCALLDSRIAAHKAAEIERERKRAEAAAAEEALRIQAAAQAEQRRHEAAAAEAQRQADAALQAAAAPPAPPAPATVPVAPPVPRSPAPAVVEEPATLSLGTICGRLGFVVSAQFLADALHVQPSRRDGRSLLYTELQFQTICRQLVSHIGAMAELYAPVTT